MSNARAAAAYQFPPPSDRCDQCGGNRWWHQMFDDDWRCERCDPPEPERVFGRAFVAIPLKDAAWEAYHYARDLLDAAQDTFETLKEAERCLDIGLVPAGVAAEHARRALHLIRTRGGQLQTLVDLVDAETETAFDELVGWSRHVPLHFEVGRLKQAAADVTDWLRPTHQNYLSGYQHSAAFGDADRRPAGGNVWQ